MIDSIDPVAAWIMIVAAWIAVIVVVRWENKK